MIDLVKNLAAVNRRTKASVIRELLKLTNKPEIISFAGGLPDPATFPGEIFADIAGDILRTKSSRALQYGPTEGLPELQEQIIRMLREDEGIMVKPENILVTTASQQALDLVGKAFIDLMDPIIVELPSYIGGLQAFNAAGAKMFGVRGDDHGLLTDELERKLHQLRDEEEHYKFVYIVPDFQNPSGVTLSEERRRKVVRLAEMYNVLLLEDSPYRAIRFEGKEPHMLFKLGRLGNTLSLFTFSKTLAPSLRVGFVVGHEAIIRRLSILKQSMDLCTSPLCQFLAAEFLSRGHYKGHVAGLRTLYKTKKDAMLEALKRYMPEGEGISWTRPEGGLFLWLRLPEGMSADDLFYEAVKENVAYVIGSAFHCDGTGQNTMRLNFSYPTTEKIDEGIKRLAKVVKANLHRVKFRPAVQAVR
ncbi:MAG: PLP-dependent aminotransferase family protein [Elusimicrobia bacterium]|nr:PLP-dependent aminotransferase family protein [Elusimicrobiota bacterium]